MSGVGAHPLRQLRARLPGAVTGELQRADNTKTTQPGMSTTPQHALRSLSLALCSGARTGLWCPLRIPSVAASTTTSTCSCATGALAWQSAMSSNPVRDACSASPQSSCPVRWTSDKLSRLHIVGETLVDVNHCLMAAPGVAKEEIRRVISHPQVCGGYGLRPCFIPGMRADGRVLGDPQHRAFVAPLPSACMHEARKTISNALDCGTIAAKF